MGLDEVVYGSGAIRNFLNHFSEQHWDRVCRATILLGLHKLQRMGNLHQMTIEQIEDIAIGVHARYSGKKAPFKPLQNENRPKNH